MQGSDRQLLNYEIWFHLSLLMFHWLNYFKLSKFQSFNYFLPKFNLKRQKIISIWNFTEDQMFFKGLNNYKFKGIRITLTIKKCFT